VQAPAGQEAATAVQEPAGEAEQAVAETKAPEKKPAAVKVAKKTAPSAKPKAKAAGEGETARAKAAAKPQKMEELSEEGVVTFLSGKVSVSRSQDWEPLDVEDLVGMDDRVRTGSDSFCEIQFADFGIIRVQDNSEILVRNVYLKEGESKVDVKLDNGNLLCKVSKLGKGEQFEVRTNTALAGVRGTEFVVREESGKATVVAVNEGRVSVVPSGIVDRIEALKGELETDTARAVLDEIAIPEIILTNKKEVSLEQKEMETVVREFEEVSAVLEQKIKEIDRKAAAVAVREEQIRSVPKASSEEKARELAEVREEKKSIDVLKEDVVARVEKKSEEIQQRLEIPEEVSKTSLKELQEIQRIKPREIIVASKEEPAGGPGAGTQERISKREEAPLRPVYAKVTIEVSPRDAELFVNDESVGRARYSGLFTPGTVLVIRAVREGYKTHIYKYTVNDRDRRQEISIELKSPVTWQLKGRGSPYIRKVASSGNSAVFADRKGRLTCVSMDGKELWSYSTKNDPNENSMPVIVDDRVVLSGTTELVALSMQSGQLLKQIPLGKGKYSSHLFGRRVVLREGTLLFPSDEAILVLNKNTLQETGVIGLPGGSQCSPALYGEKVLTVDQKGVLLVIDPATGAVETGVETDAFQPASLAPTVIGSRAVFADTKGSVAAVDLEKSELLWQRSLGGGRKGVFADIEFDEDRLYVYDGEEFYTLSLEDGKDLFSPVRSSCLPFAGEKRLYYGDMDGRFIVVDALTGNVLRSTMLGSPVSAQPLPTEQGVLLGTASGAISMLKLEDL
jgi:outer membrane protein assembly factor BamB/ferric-dicitrate binding protein FerR (iron transport regulator)